MLRLEQLFARLAQLVRRETPVDHHFALATLFEIMDVAARADLKSDVLKELDRYRGQIQGYRGHPGIAEERLDDVTTRIDRAFAELNAVQGKAGQALAANDWLMSIRSRIHIPGGTCEFDLPAYYAWQHLSAERRRSDIAGWTATLTPLRDGLQLLLSLMRDGSRPQKMIAAAGQFQQNLPQGKVFQMLRLRIDPALDVVPEISGHRLLVSIRFMTPSTDGRLRHAGGDVPFELALCA